MLTQQDLKLAKAFDGLHRRRHLYAVLYILATAIILMWLLGLGGPFAVTVGPYVFSMFNDSSTYWTESQWMHSPIAAMAGWEYPTQNVYCRLHGPLCVISGCIYNPRPLWLWQRFCINMMLLLPIAVALAFSLFWFVREFVRSASEPSMDPPTLTRDAALAIAFGPALCIGVHVAIFLLLMFLYFAVPGWKQSSVFMFLTQRFLAIDGLYRHMPPLLHWPIWSVIAFVALRAFARSRRGVLRPLRGLIWMMLIPILGMPFSVIFSSGARRSLTVALFSWGAVFVILFCLLPLFWSLGAVIALAYRWPRLRRKMMGTYCVRCGYDMRGSFAVGHHECPECGEVNTPSAGLPLQEAPHSHVGL